jgi:hypothetical protein
MKNLRLLVIIPVLCLLSFSITEPGLTRSERKTARAYMTQTKEDLLTSLKGLTAEQLNFKGAADSWSIAECVEHIALSETNLFGMIQGTLKEKADASKRNEVKNADENIFQIISDRSQKVKTQEAFKPTGKFGSHEATVNEFITKREATIKYIDTTSDDLRNHFFTFPVEAFGTLDSYQLLIFMAGHTKRHTLQIAEIKSHPAFPK